MKFVELSADEFADFARKSPYKSFMQTLEIAEYRKQNGWTPYYLGVKNGKELKAATMLVAKPNFLGKSLYLAPGGPLLDLEQTDLVNFFFRHLVKYVKSHNGYNLHIDPYYELIERDRDGIPIAKGFNRTKAVQNLHQCGFIPLLDSTQPQYLFCIDIHGRTEEELLADFKRNTRGHIRKAEKQGVTIRELKREELTTLKQITEATSKRRDFSDRPLSYYEQMYDLFHNRGEVKFIVAEAPDSTPLAAAMFMLYGDEVVYLFSGSDEKYMKEYNAQYLIQWHMIQYTAKHRFKRYNFYGISGLPRDGELDGIYEFKKGFANGPDGRVVELIGSYERPINKPFYYLHHILAKFKKSIS